MARLLTASPSHGPDLRIAQKGDAHQVAEGLRHEGFVASDIDAEDLLDYLSPFVEPAAVPEFQFNRDWMRSSSSARDPHASGGVAMKLNLPPSYLLIHRVWLGGLAVLSQLNARAAFGEVLESFFPATPRTKNAACIINARHSVGAGSRARTWLGRPGLHCRPEGEPRGCAAC